MIDGLQTELIEIFVEKLKLFAVRDEFDESEQAIVGLIFQNLKFIDHVVNGKKLLKLLFEVIGIANRVFRREIIMCFPEVLDPGLHDEAVIKLMELLTSDDDLLSQGNVETFTEMNLSPSLRGNLHRRIVEKIEKGIKIETLFSFIQFILTIKDEKIEVTPKLVVDLRKCLKWTRNHGESDAVVRTSKEKIFSLIQTTFGLSRKIIDVWLKYLNNIIEKGDFKPIDLIIFNLMISVNEEKGFQIEIILKRKIKQGLITNELLEATVAEFPAAFVEYLKDFLEVIDSFLQDRDVNVVKFGFTTYKLSFGIQNSEQLHQLLISKLPRFIGVRQTTFAISGKMSTYHKCLNPSE